MEKKKLKCKVINLSSPLKGNKEENEEDVLKHIKCMNKHGFEVEGNDNLYLEGEYEGRDSKEKAMELKKALTDKDVDLIMSLRGGYSTIKVLEHLNIATIKEHYKPIVGFSDLTPLLNYISKKTGLVTFHGPMLTTAKEDDDVNFKHLYKLLTLRTTKGYEYDSEDCITLKRGIASGKLYGGNLSMLCSMIGTGYEIPLRNTILFIEDVNEPNYKIDKMLTQLKMAGYFDKAKGVIFGNFKNCGENTKDNPKGVLSIIEKIIENTRIPVLYNFNCGHEKEMLTLPIGAEVEIINGTVIILENLNRKKRRVKSKE